VDRHPTKVVEAMTASSSRYSSMSTPVGSLVKNRWMIVNQSGAYLIELYMGRTQFSQTPTDAMITGFAWGDQDVAIRKLKEARLANPVPHLQLARVTLEARPSAPHFWRAVSSMVEPGW
jgi:hypothetical protein